MTVYTTGDVRLRQGAGSKPLLSMMFHEACRAWGTRRRWLGMILLSALLPACWPATDVDPPMEDEVSGPSTGGRLMLVAEAEPGHVVEVEVMCDPDFRQTVRVETRERGVAGELGDVIVPAPLGMCRVEARLVEEGWTCESEPVEVEVVEGITGVWLTLLCRQPDDGAINVTVEVLELDRFRVPSYEPSKLVSECGFVDIILPVDRRNDRPYTVDLRQAQDAQGRVDIAPLGDDTFRVTCLEAPADAPYSVDLVATLEQLGLRHEMPLHMLCLPGEGNPVCAEACAPADATPIELHPFATVPDLPPACARDGSTVVMAAAGPPVEGLSGCGVMVEPMDLSSLMTDPQSVLTAVICLDGPADGAPLPLDLYLGQDPELARATLLVEPGCAPYPLAGVDFEMDPGAFGDLDWTAVDEAWLVLEPGRSEGPATVRLLGLRQRCCPGAINGCGECGDEPVELCNGVDDTCDLRVDEGFPIGQACGAGMGECRAEGVLVCDPEGRGVMCDARPGAPRPEVCGNGVDEDCDGRDAEARVESFKPADCNGEDGSDDSRDACMEQPGTCDPDHLDAYCRRREGGVDPDETAWIEWGLAQARRRWPDCESWRLERTDVPGYGRRKAWVCADACRDYFWVTPLALWLPGDGPITFTRQKGARRFDIAGTGHSDPRLWPVVRWLVRLPTEGETLGPEHLFGDSTPGAGPQGWADGYAALRATVPAAADGRLTVAEAAAAGIGFWRDDNFDRIAQAVELHPLSAVDIAALDTAPDHHRRSWLAPEAFVQGETALDLGDGRRGRVLDIYLATDLAPGEG